MSSPTSNIHGQLGGHHNFSSNAFLLLLTASTAVVACSLGAALWFTSAKRRQNKRRSDEFVQAGQVHELYVFPIKSCKPNKVEWVDCGERGSSHGEERDRHFLVIDSLLDNMFLTARIYPKMTLIEAHVRENTLTVSFPGDGENEPIEVSVDLEEVQERNEVRKARSWPASQQRQSANLLAHHHRVEESSSSSLSSSLFNDSRTDGLDCGDQIGLALDRFLGVEGRRALRLIWFNEHLYTERDQPSKAEYWLNNPVPEVDDKIAYNDLASYHAFSLGSVHDLNAHLVAKGCPEIGARNFRPNLVASGLPPFDEDSWLRVRVGEAEFVCYKPCTRCVLTTVNPDTGVKSDKMQPLKELRNYRLAPGKLYDVFKESPIFGVNMAIVKPGRVRVGDPLWIQYKPSPF